MACLLQKWASNLDQANQSYDGLKYGVFTRNYENVVSNVSRWGTFAKYSQISYMLCSSCLLVTFD